jgi:hypothetical protein
MTRTSTGFPNGSRQKHRRFESGSARPRSYARHPEKNFHRPKSALLQWNKPRLEEIPTANNDLASTNKHERCPDIRMGVNTAHSCHRSSKRLLKR